MSDSFDLAIFQRFASSRPQGSEVEICGHGGGNRVTVDAKVARARFVAARVEVGGIREHPTRPLLASNVPMIVKVRLSRIWSRR